MKLLAKVSSCHKKDTRVQFATILLFFLVFSYVFWGLFTEACWLVLNPLLKGLSLARSRTRKAQGARKKRWQVNAILGRSFSKPNEKTAQERERGSGVAT